jgi:MOSC domain-containing protein
MDNLTISGIFIYPIKSLSGIALESSSVEKRGLQYDRRWVLVNDENLFMHQRDHNEMALFQPSISDETMIITQKNDPNVRFEFPLKAEGTIRENVTVWDDTCKAIEVSEKVSQWFTKKLNISCRLMYMPDDSIRLADQRFAIKSDDKVSFADGYPILAISEASMALLNTKTAEEIPADRFRPNFLINGAHPHVEDELRSFSIGSTEYYGVKPCARCVVTTINQTTAERGKEPLKSLASYRKAGNKILFGHNIIPMNIGNVKVGDTISVKEWSKPLAF